MRKKLMVWITAAVLAFPAVALADVSIDLRLKGGNAAGADTLVIDSFVDASGSGDNSSNVQGEVVFSPLQNHPVGPVFSIGVFHRTHSGTVEDFLAFPTPLLPTSIDYDVTGVSLGFGIRLKPSANFHFEGKFELGLGSGKLDPGIVFNPTKEEGYVSSSVLVGAYYTFTMPRLQLGIEVGAQSFRGDFQILDSTGFWNDGHVEGSGGIVNFVVGYRF